MGWNRIYFYLCVIVYIGKLASRSQRVAHYLLNKLGGGKALVPGDRVSVTIIVDEHAYFACGVVPGGLGVQSS